MKKTNIKTTAYEYKDGYMCDIVVDGKMFDAWLYIKSYHYKLPMFGVDSSVPKPAAKTEEEFITLVEAAIDDFIPEYLEEYQKINGKIER